ncbi:MAG: FkbM family methyltransferase [Candidatus Rokuibacteriota bacterium]
MTKVLTSLLRRAVRAAGYKIIPRRDNHAFASHLRVLFARMGIDCVLDVGANLGQYRQFLRKEVGYTGHIASFEPQAACLRELETRARRDPLWTIYGFALGSEGGQQSLNVMRESAFTSFLPPDSSVVPKFMHLNTIAHVETVVVKRLDDVIDEIRATSGGRSMYLKLDTQGYDLEVIKGASAALASVAALQTEISVQPIYDRMPDWLTSLRILKEHGLDVTGLFPVSQDPQLRVIEFDCVAVNAAFRRPA